MRGEEPMPEGVERYGSNALGGLMRDETGQAGYLVLRERLVSAVLSQRDAAISVLCAPRGFGKTAMLLQCASEVRNDPDRGVAELMTADGRSFDELLDKIDALVEDLSPAMHPLLGIDDLPLLKSGQITVLVSRLRELRSEGYSVVVACTPANRRFVNALGDSLKIGAQQLRVQPGEYARWARLFSISSDLDVYDFTQGIPALVSALKTVTKGPGGTAFIDSQIASLYRSALKDAANERNGIHRLMSLLIILGEGNLSELDRHGMRVRADMLARLKREYPVFALDMETRAFACLGAGRAALKGLREEVARENPDLLRKAVRIHLSARRINRAIKLMNALCSQEEKLEMISRYPAAFAVTGNAGFVRETLALIDANRAASVGVGVVLALYMASLSVGDYRTARSASGELCRRAQEVERDAPASDWAVAEAMRRVWSSCQRMDLPQIKGLGSLKEETGDARSLLLHAKVYCGMFLGEGSFASEECGSVPDDLLTAPQLDIPRLLLWLDEGIGRAIYQGSLVSNTGLVKLDVLAKRLAEAKLGPIAARVRMSAALLRLLAGKPIADERAFGDAGTVAIRESDQMTQLLCLIAEGWQELALGQAMNARFRGQQALKLLEEDDVFLRSWALLLERCAMLVNSSSITVREEAEILDLSCEVDTPAEAWCVALLLSAARYDSDLSIWFSLHKSLLLQDSFRAIARLAIAGVGSLADSVKRLIPSGELPGYLLEGTDAKPLPERGGFSLFKPFREVGQVNISLFGGFLVNRNGHVLTDDLWHRRKAGILAARLALDLGSYIGRRVLMEELWPESDFPRARQNLYTTTSVLKAAFHQEEDGPCYVMVQGDGMALNPEYVSCDTAKFDRLAREILLGRAGKTAHSTVEACLKLEELYAVPLYVPESGNVTFFTRMRQAYESKYVDCLVRGIDAALSVEDTAAASWLTTAALRQAPLREDVLRHAMTVLGESGRKREVIELYGAHLRYLQGGALGDPDPETRRLYEEITEDPARRMVL